MYGVPGPYRQRGRGLGSILSSLFRSIIPVASKVGKSILRSPVTKNIARAARDAAIEGAMDVAADTLRGENVGTSLVKSLDTAKGRVADAIQVEGGRRRGRKRKPVRTRRGKNKKSKDIFS